MPTQYRSGHADSVPIGAFRFSTDRGIPTKYRSGHSDSVPIGAFRLMPDGGALGWSKPTAGLTRAGQTWKVADKVSTTKGPGPAEWNQKLSTT
eukprot:774822-Rhodomonas_salina.1